MKDSKAKLQEKEKPPSHQREHPAPQKAKSHLFRGLFLPAGIQIRSNDFFSDTLSETGLW